MKSESGFSLVIASQPFQVLGRHGSWIIRAILDRSGPFSELKRPFRTILDRLDHFGQFWTKFWIVGGELGMLLEKKEF